MFRMQLTGAACWPKKRDTELPSLLEMPVPAKCHPASSPWLSMLNHTLAPMAGQDNPRNPMPAESHQTSHRSAPLSICPRLKGWMQVPLQMPASQISMTAQVPKPNYPALKERHPSIFEPLRQRSDRERERDGRDENSFKGVPVRPGLFQGLRHAFGTSTSCIRAD